MNANLSPGDSVCQTSFRKWISVWQAAFRSRSCSLFMHSDEWALNDKEAVLDESTEHFLTRQWNTRKFACLFALATQWNYVIMSANRQDASGRASVQGPVRELLANRSKDRWCSSPMLRRLLDDSLEVFCSALLTPDSNCI